MWHLAVLGHERAGFKLGYGMWQCWGMSEEGLSLGVGCGGVGHERAGFMLGYGMWQCWGMSEQGLSLGVACGSVGA